MSDLPFVRFGRGPRPLVVFPTLGDAIRPVTAAAPLVGWYYGRFANDFTVFVVSRRRGLAPGTTTRDMGAEYAAFVDRHVGPAHVLGLSLGGLVAHHFAADYPDRVRRLVIGVAGVRLSAEGRAIVRRWIERARDGRWGEIYADSADVLFTGLRRLAYRALVQHLGPALLGRPIDPNDFIVSAEAALAHDAITRLAAIQAPTLVLAGRRDRLFPEALLRETAAAIPGVTVQLLGGAHGVFHEDKRAYDHAVRDFVKRAA